MVAQLRVHRRRVQCHRDEGGHRAGKHRIGLMRRGASRLCIDHWFNSRIDAGRGVAGRSNMGGIGGGLMQTQAMLPEPAMQHISIHAMLTCRGGNGGAGLLAGGNQLGLELRAVDPACARD